MQQITETNPYPIVSYFANLILLIVVAVTVIKSKTTEILRGEKAAWAEKAARLEGEKTAMADVIKQREIELAECRAKTDVSKLIERIEALAKVVVDHSEMDRITQEKINASMESNTVALREVARLVQESITSNREAMTNLARSVRIVDEHLSKSG
jgi:predicted molibdopterin-dependent oxidoreductase YjgC